MQTGVCVSGEFVGNLWAERESTKGEREEERGSRREGEGGEGDGERRRVGWGGGR